MAAKFILKDRTPVVCHDLMEWANWFETADRNVAKTDVGHHRVSTVFLGIDHQFGHGEPLLFETMVFTAGDDGGDMKRYSTWEDAEDGHWETVKRLRASETQEAGQK